MVVDLGGFDLSMRLLQDPKRDETPLHSHFSELLENKYTVTNGQLSQAPVDNMDTGHLGINLGG